MSAAPNLIKSKLLEKALELAAIGRSILPVGLNKKPLLKEWASLQAAGATADQITDWSSTLKPAAWAVVCGAVSGAVIVDFDGDPGRAWLERFKLRSHVQTGSGGYHVHFKHPGIPVKTMNAKSAKNVWPWPGVDIRGDGGYALTVGRNSHGSYEQLRAFDDLDAFEMLPENLRCLVLKAPAATVQPIRASKSLEDRLIASALDLVSNGSGRNNAGFSLACQLRDNEFSQADAEGVMRRYASACPGTNAKGQPEPYSDSEIRASLNQAFSASPRERWGKASRTGVQQFQDSVQDALDAAEREPLPAIKVSNRQLRDASRESLEALNKANAPAALFARSGFMVAVIRNENGRLVISEVSESALRGRLSRAANFLKHSPKGDPIDVPPPMDVVRDILSLAPAEWGFLPLDGIVEIPVLKPDGSILDTAGYDNATRLFYAPDPVLRIPEVPYRPTADHLDIAKETILELIKDFAFVDQASRANGFAALLTPIIKPAINKPTPLGCISATAAGTGKSLLVELVSILATGRPAEMLSAPQDQDEWRKQITTALITGVGVIVFDNVSQRLDSGELCKALTADIYADRLLRTNEPVRIPVQCTWFATGNNIQLGGDMPRRCYWIRMDAETSTPFLRTNFSHPDLKGYVTEHRGEILAALLTLARAWFVAGKPKPEVTPIGSFEDWTVMVGGILAYAGVEGFLGNSAEAYEQADQEGIEWDLFLRVLKEVFRGEPFRVSQVWEVARQVRWSGSENVPTETAKQLRESLPGTLLEVQEQQGKFARRLGKCLAALEGRRFGSDEIHVVRTGIVHKVQEWQICGGVQNSA